MYKPTGKVFGQGTFGKVFQVTDGKKTFAQKTCTYLDYLAETKIEKKIMETLSRPSIHPGRNHIVHLITSIPNDIGFDLLIEEYEGTLLKLIKDAMNKNEILGEELVLDLIQHVSLGLSYMNRNGYAHCDLKPENILWKKGKSSSGYHFAISDFGSALKCQTEYYYPIQTRQYRCIENLLELPNITSCDMHSLGCIVYETITGTFLSNKKPELSQLKELFEIIGREKMKRFELDETFSNWTLCIYSYRGQLSKPGCKRFQALHQAFDKKNYKKRNEFIDFILECIIPFPDKRLQASDVPLHSLFMDEDDYEYEDEYQEYQEYSSSPICTKKEQRMKEYKEKQNQLEKIMKKVNC